MRLEGSLVLDRFREWVFCLGGEASESLWVGGGLRREHALAEDRAAGLPLLRAMISDPEEGGWSRAWAVAELAERGGGWRGRRFYMTRVFRFMIR